MVGVLHALLLFPGHGMTGKKASVRALAEDGLRSLQDFNLVLPTSVSRDFSERAGAMRLIKSIMLPTGVASTTTWLPNAASTG